MFESLVAEEERRLEKAAAKARAKEEAEWRAKMQEELELEASAAAGDRFSDWDTVSEDLPPADDWWDDIARQAARAAHSSRHPERSSSRESRKHLPETAQWREQMQAEIRAHREKSEEAELDNLIARYHEAWATFATSPPPVITLANIPWPPRHWVDRLKKMGTEGKQMVRHELRRWHPDKFDTRYGPLLCENDRVRIKAQLQSLVQSLTTLVNG
mmetsp:Transcript_62857/g.148872  ORF Transcript_62857/g.148872 Transcript_62857/m.148872 type:complete len:215 (-) Transcript_62857:100-744(-)